MITRRLCRTRYQINNEFYRFFQIHKNIALRLFKFTLIGVNFFVKKIRIKLLLFEKIWHIKYVQIKKEVTTCRQQ